MPQPHHIIGCKRTPVQLSLAAWMVTVTSFFHQQHRQHKLQYSRGGGQLPCQPSSWGGKRLTGPQSTQACLLSAHSVYKALGFDASQENFYRIQPSGPGFTVPWSAHMCRAHI